MLTENDVIISVCQKLREIDFEIIQSLHTSEKGIDIIAKKESYYLYVEAKGATSASPNSNRFGKPFNQNQIENHIARALLTVSKLMSKNIGKLNIGVAIALPDNLGHRKIIGQIDHALKILEIKVFWVKDLHNVELNLNVVHKIFP
jgi:hypothetical protein